MKRKIWKRRRDGVKQRYTIGRKLKRNYGFTAHVPNSPIQVEQFYWEDPKKNVMFESLITEKGKPESIHYIKHIEQPVDIEKESLLKRKRFEEQGFKTTKFGKEETKRIINKSPVPAKILSNFLDVDYIEPAPNIKYLQRPEVIARRKAYAEEYNQRPEVKEKQREYQQRPEYKEKQKEYFQSPEFRKKQREYKQLPEVKARDQKYWQSPEYKEKKREYRQQPENKENARKYYSEYIKDPEVKEKRREAVRKYRLNKTQNET